MIVTREENVTMTSVICHKITSMKCEPPRQLCHWCRDLVDLRMRYEDKSD